MNSEHEVDELEREVDRIRSNIGELIRELNHRRHEALDLRLQLRQHAGRVLLVGAVVVATIAGGIALALARLRRRRSIRLRVSQLRGALRRLAKHPERPGRAVGPACRARSRPPAAARSPPCSASGWRSGWSRAERLSRRLRAGGRRSGSRGGRSTCRSPAPCARPAGSAGSSSARRGTSPPSSPCAGSAAARTDRSCASRASGLPAPRRSTTSACRGARARTSRRSTPRRCRSCRSRPQPLAGNDPTGEVIS